MEVSRNSDSTPNNYSVALLLFLVLEIVPRQKGPLGPTTCINQPPSSIGTGSGIHNNNEKRFKILLNHKIVEVWQHCGCCGGSESVR